MRSNNTFATTLTTMTMDRRDTLFAKLGNTSQDDLRKILAAIRLHHTTTEEDHKDNSSDHEANQATVSLPNHDPQDQPKVPKQPTHAGIFAQAYASNTLANKHAKLYADSDTVDPDDVHQYLRALSNIDIAQRPCFVVCTGGTVPSIAVLHDIAAHQRNLHAKSRYDGGTYAFLHNADPGKHTTTVKLRLTWFDNENLDHVYLRRIQQCHKERTMRGHT